MCLGSIGWCFYAVVSVAFGFGPKKAGEWLASFCMSFFESVFCTQPIKVSVGLSLLKACSYYVLEILYTLLAYVIYQDKHHLFPFRLSLTKYNFSCSY